MLEKYTNEKYIARRGKKTEADFLKYLEEKKDPEKEKVIQELVHNRTKKISETGLSYRTINHWKEKGLLKEHRENENGWNKFSIMEIVWIHILKKLRDFGIPIITLIFVKSHIYGWGKVIKPLRIELFEYYIIQALVHRKEIYIIVTSTGNTDIVDQEDLELTKQAHPNLEYICISLTGIITRVNPDVKRRTDNIKDIKNMFPLNEREDALVKKIQDSIENSINIKKGKNGSFKFKAKNIEITTINNFKDKPLIEIVKEHKNSNIVISTNHTGNISNIKIEKQI